LTDDTGLLAQLYYRIESDDPATSFWAAKQWFARELDPANPYEYKALHSFLYFGLPEVGALPGRLQPVGTLSEDAVGTRSCPSGNAHDCDGDGLSEDLEQEIAETFMPYMIFDRLEPVDPHTQLQVYWQVSPDQWAEGTGPYCEPGPPRHGAWLTMIMAYPYDYGTVDIDVQSTNGPHSWIGGKIVDAFLDDVDYHCGDTEAIRFFVQYGNGNTWEGVHISTAADWEVTHVDWKRHHEGFWESDAAWCGDPVSIQGVQRIDRHPVVYVARNKHATYPSTYDCNNHIDHLEKWGGFISVDIKHDKCDPDPDQSPYLPEAASGHNVGERPGYGGFPLLDWLPEYPGERAWGGFGTWFCGAQPVCVERDYIIQKMAVCSGGMGKMWFPDTRYLELHTQRQFTFKIKTSDIYAAGTDADVYVTVFGTKYSNTAVELDPPGHGDFERNKMDTVEVRLVDPGEIEGLCIRHNRKGDGDGWHLESVTIIRDDGRTWEFPFNRWLDVSEPPYYSVAAGAGTAPRCDARWDE
jgi:hypothetical protein